MAGHPSGRAAVVDVYRSLLDAWNRRDAQGFAALFAADGSAVGFDGSQMDGSAQVEAELTGVFANHPTASYVAIVREVRSLAPDVHLLRAVVGMIPPGKDEINPATNAIQSLVVVSDGSGLRIALLQNTPAAFHGRPEVGEELTRELAAVARAGELVRGPSA